MRKVSWLSRQVVDMYEQEDCKKIIVGEGPVLRVSKTQIRWNPNLITKFKADNYCIKKEHHFHPCNCQHDNDYRRCCPENHWLLSQLLPAMKMSCEPCWLSATSWRLWLSLQSTVLSKRYRGLGVITLTLLSMKDLHERISITISFSHKNKRWQPAQVIIIEGIVSNSGRGYWSSFVSKKVSSQCEDRRQCFSEDIVRTFFILKKGWTFKLP